MYVTEKTVKISLRTLTFRARGVIICVRQIIHEVRLVGEAYVRREDDVAGVQVDDGRAGVRDLAVLAVGDHDPLRRRVQIAPPPSHGP